MQIDLNDLDDDVIELLKVSGRLRTKEALMRELVLDAIDPIVAQGAVFRFEQRPIEDEMYLSLEVPGGGDRVDLAECWKVARLDAEAAARVLDRDDSLAATLRVYANQYRWLAFWS